MAELVFPVTPGAVAVPTLALITLIIDTPPLIWHIRNRNLAASSLVFWVLISNLMNFVNALIWPTDDIFHWWDGSGLCDIEVKIMLAAGFGVIGSLACIMRSLATVLDTNRTILSPSKAQRRRKIIVDCLFCFGGPIYCMAFVYIVQPDRYWIFAISGCTATVSYSWPTIVLIEMWPPILCLVAVYYSVLVIIRMHKYRKEFSEVLRSSNSNLTKSRFMRLFWLSITLIVVTLPVQYYVLYRNSSVPFVKYSWDNIHADWGITMVPTGGVVTFDRWIQIAIGFAVFIFFGLGQDARTMYSKWLIALGFKRIFPCLGRSPLARQPATSSGTSGTREFFNRRWSRGSFLSLHSHKSKSNPASVATLSPSEPPNGFSHLSTIIEYDKRTTDSHTATSSDTANEKDVVPAADDNTHSWLTQFLIRTHLSAPNRQYMARPNIPSGPHGLGFFGTNVQSGVNSPARPNVEDV